MFVFRLQTLPQSLGGLSGVVLMPFADTNSLLVSEGNSSPSNGGFPFFRG